MIAALRKRNARLALAKIEDYPFHGRAPIFQPRPDKVAGPTYSFVVVPGQRIFMFATEEKLDTFLRVNPQAVRVEGLRDQLGGITRVKK